MRKRKHISSGGTARFFFINLSHDTLENYYQTNFLLAQEHQYSLTELDNMIPWEREIIIYMLIQHMKEKNQQQQQMANLKAVNETLLSQNEILRDTQKSVLSTNNLLSKTLESQLKAASMAKLKDLEKDREGGRFSRVAGGLSAAGGAIKGGAEKGLGNIQGMLGKIGSFLVLIQQTQMTLKVLC